MVATSYFKGNKIYYDLKEKLWKYSYTHEPITVIGECPRCKQHMKVGSPDSCIGLLPGVIQGCCGHGVKKGYLMFNNGIILRFDNLSVEK